MRLKKDEGGSDLDCKHCPFQLLDCTPNVKGHFHQTIFPIKKMADSDLAISVNADCLAFDREAMRPSKRIRGSYFDIGIVAHTLDLSAVGIGPDEYFIIFYYEPDGCGDSLA